MALGSNVMHHFRKNLSVGTEVQCDFTGTSLIGGLEFILCTLGMCKYFRIPYWLVFGKSEASHLQEN
jgi:hypothetical protein